VIKGVVDKFPIASVETIPGFTVNTFVVETRINS
jgi:hypothetical protein